MHNPIDWGLWLREDLVKVLKKAATDGWLNHEAPDYYRGIASVAELCGLEDLSRQIESAETILERR